jgi:hypothetical protein
MADFNQNQIHILLVINHFFSEKGFAGSSIRAIFKIKTYDLLIIYDFNFKPSSTKNSQLSMN